VKKVRCRSRRLLFLVLLSAEHTDAIGRALGTLGEVKVLSTAEHETQAALNALG